jgi:hypothetical protein
MINIKVTSVKTMPRSPETEAMVMQHLASKTASSLGTNAVTEAMIEKYRAEYQEFLKNLDNMDFSTMMTPEPTEKQTEVPTEEPLPEAVHEEAYGAFVKADEPAADLVNGISVGDEAGESMVIASTKKNRRKKSSDDDVVAE